ncbi:hypothetical protein [Streptomyces sp. NPDC005438]|uniref:hypothetical protein n=1 Tax=Streptomyces sp. NPDC005438 TaxID=3156880 RepID=UPI0033B6C6B5
MIRSRAAFDTLAGAGDLAPLTPDSAATLLGTGEHRAETLLEELVEVHLLHVSRTSPEDHFHYVWDPAVETLRAPRAPWEAPTSALAPFLAA